MIPYNSIIDQTVDVFEGLFGGELEILRHQSTFSYEDAENQDEDYQKAAKLAAENWDAPFIVTTAVQFFESVYANKRGKLRKRHNIADSILVFDESSFDAAELSSAMSSVDCFYYQISEQRSDFFDGNHAGFRKFNS